MEAGKKWGKRRVQRDGKKGKLEKKKVQRWEEGENEEKKTVTVQGEMERRENNEEKETSCFSLLQYTW